MVLNQFKMEISFLTKSSFPNFIGFIAIFPNLTGPWPKLQKGRKIPASLMSLYNQIPCIVCDLKNYGDV